MPEKSKCLGIYYVHIRNKAKRYDDIGYLSTDLEQYPTSFQLLYGRAQSKHFSMSLENPIFSRMSCAAIALSTSITKTRCRSALEWRIPGTLPWEFGHDNELRKQLWESRSLGPSSIMIIPSEEARVLPRFHGEGKNL